MILPLRKLGFAILPSRKWDSPVCLSQTIHTRKYAVWRICCQINFFLPWQTCLPVLPLPDASRRPSLHSRETHGRSARDTDDAARSSKGERERIPAAASTAASDAAADGRLQGTSWVSPKPARRPGSVGRRRCCSKWWMENWPDLFQGYVFLLCW